MGTKKALDKAIKVCDTDITKNDVKKIYSILSSAIQNSSNPRKVLQLVEKAQSEAMSLMMKL
ncbi:hypothetical protein AB434P3_00001 [Agathobaculum phage AB434P3]|nr:hypothetical protein AB434P3_00001 [Agathobaculum phage AB434P3]